MSLPAELILLLRAASGPRREPAAARRPGVARWAAPAVVVLLAGCGALPAQRMAQDESPVVIGPAARRNQTPLEGAFACLSRRVRESGAPVVGIAVGDVKDYTGKYNQNEGNAITQGGSLMVYSALGKLAPAVRLHERFDTRVAELELVYTDRRQLGDGRTHAVEPGKPGVAWVPYFGGSILQSNYYIIGGITEANFNIASGGVEAVVNGVGVRGRTYTMNVGVDLRIVDTRSLVVAHTVSFTKQIVGEEVGANMFRFFGVDLVDVNAGSKRQEPLQLGVRTTIEQGVIELVAAVTGVEASPCLAGQAGNPGKAPEAGSAGSTVRDASGQVVATSARPLRAAGPARAADTLQRYAVVLMSSPSGPPRLARPLPPALAGLQLFGAQREVDGLTRQELRLGHFTDRASAVAALKLLAEEYPMAHLVSEPVPAGALQPLASETPGGGQLNGNGNGAGGASLPLPFEVGQTTVAGAALQVIEHAVRDSARGATVTLQLTARDSEPWTPAQRHEMANARVRAVTDALAAQGVAASRVRASWVPAPTDSNVVRQGAGYQLVATVVVRPASVP